MSEQILAIGSLRRGLRCLALTGTALVALPFAAWAEGERDLTIAVLEEPLSLDGCDASHSSVGRIIRGNVVESLTQIDTASGLPVAKLATDWEQMDPRTWRFRLREGVTFHDGTPLNAEAVAKSATRTLSGGLNCVTGDQYFNDAEYTVSAIDDLTVEIASSQPEPIMPTRVAFLDITAPATPDTEKSRAAIGTGPYSIEEWRPGQDISLKRAQSYWGEQPSVEAATYIWRSESAVRAAMVQTGEADLALEIAPQDATTPQDIAYPNSETSFFAIDVTVPPLNDRRIREAINLAIDRQGLRGTLFHADATPATQVILPGVFGHNPDIPVWPYDPERAMQLVQEAAADGVDISLPIYVYGRIGVYTNAGEVVEALQAMISAIGLNAQAQMFEVAAAEERNQKPRAEGRPANIHQAQHDNNKGDAVFSVFTKYHTDGIQSRISDPELDYLILRAQAAVGDERLALWQQVFQRINVDIITDVPLFYMVSSVRVGDRINYMPDIRTNTQIELATVSFN